MTAREDSHSPVQRSPVQDSVTDDSVIIPCDYQGEAIISLPSTLSVRSGVLLAGHRHQAWVVDFMLRQARG
jgi:hypothetical protein